MKVTYPVIFTDVDTNILIEIPDLGILTEANEEGRPKGSIADAITMARDAIGLSCIEAEDDGKEVVHPSEIKDIDVSKGTFFEDGTGIVSLVDVDLSVYRRMLDNKMVRRNVTLPNWLNQEAEKSHINVSKVLQEALMARLGVSR
ncbi:type II toxin-antitoxin system HicB family antitoxin [Eubacterium sp. MSJ-13]|uniref:type II toxin-antitoxin system HicB family antitoxin n=1 Tax=Eubacterium sp. MSJ-13 TaxID=2841513 RepID=UPI001C10A81D|nr:type II toxin-antitoxin system HicB family antitoxin [Eubacterium sp. MSJ-13]MBU5478047.1 type II toxin-antitoxin system HicB family antitoxin [Eubacterium sp. MSJ-13]